MKHVQVTITKIRPEIYQLIEAGRKKWEVRDEPFLRSMAPGTPHVIAYVTPEGEFLGLWKCLLFQNDVAYCGLTPDGSLDSNSQMRQTDSGVDEKTFRELFDLKTGTYLHAAFLSRRLDSLSDLLVEEEES